MTFDQLFTDYRLTPDERADLVYRLAAIRARKTIEALLSIGAVEDVAPGRFVHNSHD